MPNEEFKPSIQPAISRGIIPLIALTGLSGGGKTRTALKLARGMAGPKGKIRVIDTERGRASIFADKIPGGYDVIDLDGPFTPENYLKAMTFAVDQGTDILVIDSASHEWNGEGGVLEMQEAELDRMAGNDYAKRERVKMAAWIKPKAQHYRFIRELLRVKIPVICCLRGKEKTRMVRGKDGKTEVVTDNFCTPTFDSEFFFETLFSAEVLQRDGKGGYLHVMKMTHEDLWPCLPKMGEEDAEQVDYVHGEKIMAWCKHRIGTLAAGKAKDSDAVRKLKKELWDATEKKHLGDKKVLQQWLWDEGIMSDTEFLEEGVPEARLLDIVTKTKERLKAKP